MHEGHRNRLVNKLKCNAKIYEHELLEILLFNSCPRKDLNATAHLLISRFGSLENVLNADCSDLVEVEGVGENIAAYLSVLGKSLNLLSNEICFAKVINLQEFKRFIISRGIPENERVELYCLDKDGRVIRICVYKAVAGLRADVDEAELLTVLSLIKPYGLFAARRRINGICPPDSADDLLAEKIDGVARLCGINFYDYCLVGDGDYFYSYKMADRTVFGAAGAQCGDGI